MRLLPSLSLALQKPDGAWCTSRNKLLRIDPLVDPGIPAQHVYAMRSTEKTFPVFTKPFQKPLCSLTVWWMSHIDNSVKNSLTTLSKPYWTTEYGVRTEKLRPVSSLSVPAWWAHEVCLLHSLLSINPLVDPGIPAQHVHIFTVITNLFLTLACSIWGSCRTVVIPSKTRYNPLQTI